MFRKTILAAAAMSALAAAALAPTAASAHHWKFGPRFGFGPGFGYGNSWGYPTYFAPPLNCYWVKKVTPFGFQSTKVCSYY